MALAAGTRVGPYEVTALLGAGGMGEVYLATDTRLDRTVALKVLPAALASDPEFQARFAREARTISSLDHPHICALHDVGESEGLSYLVMPRLDGETLAKRLERGPLPVDQALRVGGEIASALDHAHRLGIVHRDLKPGNVMLTRTGARLLDFGLARRATTGEAMTGVATAMTVSGTVMGTVPYMAPEQIEGREADARSDLFAFGIVLYEMVTGTRAFGGSSNASVMGAILRDTPPAPSVLVPGLPPALDHVVERCLAKAPDERWACAHDLAIALAWVRKAGAASQALPVDEGPPRTARRPLRWAIGSLALAAIAALAGWWLRAPIREIRQPSRFTLAPPPGVTAWRGEGLAATISPDGRIVAVVVPGDDARASIWLRHMDDPAWRKVEDAPPTSASSVSSSLPTGRTVFWSADSRLLLYVEGSELRRVSINGGQGTVIGSVPNPSDLGGGTANAEGVILLGYFSGPLLRMSMGGGSATPVAPLDTAHGEIAQMTPSFLPDGVRYLFVSRSKEWTTVIGRLGSSERVDLHLNTYAPRYVSPGVMAFITPVARVQRFELPGFRVEGDSRPIEPQSAPVSLSVSDTGSLAYFTSGSQPRQRNWNYGEITSDNARLLWLDRSGKELGSLTAAGGYMSPRLSPDGLSLATETFDEEQEGEIWLYDVRRAVGTRLTTNPDRDADAVWSPAGDRIAWTRNGSTGAAQVLVQSIDRGALPTVVKQFRTGDGTVFVSDWSPDGQYLVLSHSPSFGRSRLEMLPLEGATPVPWSTTAPNESQARFSPDGRWIAYVSDETGAPEIYVRSFPSTAIKLRISGSGGFQPAWRRDGAELYFVASDRTLTAVPVHAEDGRLEFGTPQALFRAPIAAPGEGRNHYDASADGNRFLVNAIRPAAARPMELVVVLDWAQAMYDELAREPVAR